MLLRLGIPLATELGGGELVFPVVFNWASLGDFADACSEAGEAEHVLLEAVWRL